MKLSTKPRHLAPVMRVRDLRGKLVKRVYWTRSNSPGRTTNRPILKPSAQELIIKGESNLLTDRTVVAAEMGRLQRILRFLRGTPVIAICGLLALHSHAQDFGPHHHQPRPVQPTQHLTADGTSVKLNTKGRLPDLTLTQGSARADASVDQICSESTINYRHTSLALKKQVCKEYGYKPGTCPADGKMEVDHLIPLELGGADVRENLWIQTAPDYHMKDKLENELHRRVCAHDMTLTFARKCIHDNWVSCYHTVMPAEKPAAKKPAKSSMLDHVRLTLEPHPAFIGKSMFMQYVPTYHYSQSDQEGQ